MRSRLIQPDVFVEARRFDEETWEDLSAWLPKDRHMFVASPGRISLHFDRQVIHPGHWIIQYEDGRFTTATPDEFRRHFQPVDEDGEPLPVCEACGDLVDPDDYKTDSEGVVLCDKDFAAL